MIAPAIGLKAQMGIMALMSVPEEHLRKKQLACLSQNAGCTPPDFGGAASFSLSVAQKSASSVETTHSTKFIQRTLVDDENSVNLTHLMNGITELFNGPEEDEYGQLSPSSEGMLSAFVLFISVASEHNTIIPKGHVTTDSGGDLRIRWKNEDRELRLILPYKAPDSPELYIRSSKGANLIKNIDAAQLTEHFQWLRGQGVLN